MVSPDDELLGCISMILISDFVNGASQPTVDPLGCDSARSASVRPLSETCHTFHRICQPLLFETLSISHYPESRRSMIDVLENKPYLRSMVSTVRIRSTGGSAPDLWDRLEKALMELYSVREVFIQLADTSRTLWNHFQRCTRLETLVLSRVKVTHLTEPTSFSLHSLKHLRHDSFYELKVADFFTALILPQLETLHIDSGFLFGADVRCRHNIFQFRPSVLKELTIKAPLWINDAEVELLELLTRANGIRSLKFVHLPPLSQTFIPDDLIPELEVFQGPSETVLTFCRGRPVRELCTWFDRDLRGSAEEMTDSIPNLIRPGTIPLEHLELGRIHWDGDTMGYIARHCPQLVSLKIRANSRNGDGKLSNRYHMPKLREATFLLTGDFTRGSWFTDGEMKAAMEVEVIQECREFWTQLEYLRLDPDYFWRFRGPEVEQFQGEEIF